MGTLQWVHKQRLCVLILYIFLIYVAGGGVRLRAINEGYCVAGSATVAVSEYPTSCF